MLKKILIVEDEHDVIKLLKYNLEKEGFKVSYTTDGSLALAEIRRDEPDLVILDLMLPGLDRFSWNSRPALTKRTIFCGPGGWKKPVRTSSTALWG